MKVFFHLLPNKVYLSKCNALSVNGRPEVSEQRFMTLKLAETEEKINEKFECRKF